MSTPAGLASVAQPAGTAVTVANVTAPTAVAESASGDLYAAVEQGNSEVVVKRAAGQVGFTVVAGATDPTVTNTADGPADSVALGLIAQIALAPDGSLLIADQLDGRLRRLSGGTLTTVAGDGSTGSYGGDGLALTGMPIVPVGVAVAPNGTEYVMAAPFGTDTSAHLLRINPDDTGTTVAGGGSTDFGPGPALDSRIGNPGQIAAKNSAVYMTRFDINKPFELDKVSGGSIAVLATKLDWQSNCPTLDAVAVGTDGVVWAAHCGRLIAADSDGPIDPVSDPFIIGGSDSSWPPSPTTTPIMDFKFDARSMATGTNGSILMANNSLSEIRRLVGPGVWPSGWAPTWLDEVDSFPDGVASVEVNPNHAGAASYTLAAGYQSGSEGPAPATMGPVSVATLGTRQLFTGVKRGPGVVTVYLNGAERVTGAGPIWVGDPVSQSFTYPTAFPERPAGLTARRTADNCIKLSWQPAAGANEYVLERIDGVHPTQYPRQRTGMVDSAPILDCEQMSAPQHTYTYTVWGLDINTYAFSSATNVVVGVIPNVTLTASRHQLLSGASDTFRVHVTNPLAQDQTTPTPASGTRVDLQHRTSGTWITVRHGRTDLNGHVAWKVSPIIGGAWRALVVQSHRYQQTVSSVVHVSG